jgi:cephalosporin hydroxylase
MAAARRRPLVGEGVLGGARLRLRAGSVIRHWRETAAGCPMGGVWQAVRDARRVVSEPVPVNLPGGGRLPESEAEIVRSADRLLFDRFPTIWKGTHWMGVSIYKLPPDLQVIQEIVFETRPELVIETGVAAGGATLMFANLFDLLGEGGVIGIETDLSLVDERVREHPRIRLIEASSTDPAVAAQLTERAAGRRVMVDLDADHSSSHVLGELQLLAPLVSPGCYLVVEDTWFGTEVVRDHSGPATAIEDWLAAGQPFEVDRSREKFLISSNRGGYLRRTGGEPVAEPARSHHERRAERMPDTGLPPMPEDGDAEAMQDWMRSLFWRFGEQAAEIERLRKLAGEEEEDAD